MHAGDLRFGNEKENEMNNLNANKTVTIPVPMDYANDMTILGVSKKDIKIMKLGDIRLKVFFTEVPAHQARELLKFTWAEVDFNKPSRRRKEKGLVDCGLEEIENFAEETWVEDPFFDLIQMEVGEEQEKIIAYLEKKHRYYGEIYRERLYGNFNYCDIGRKLHISECNIRRWTKEVKRLASEYYFKNFF